MECAIGDDSTIEEEGKTMRRSYGVGCGGLALNRQTGVELKWGGTSGFDNGCSIGSQGQKASRPERLKTSCAKRYVRPIHDALPSGVTLVPVFFSHLASDLTKANLSPMKARLSIGSSCLYRRPPPLHQQT